MSNAKNQPPADEQLAQAAIHCYLSTVLTVTDALAESCPNVGASLKRRWARAPQRIGFEPTIRMLQASRQAFEADIRAYADYTARYFRQGLPLIDTIAASGSDTADAVLERVGAHSVLLETLSESLATVADLDVPEEIRETLEHQAAGLKNCARQAERDLLPLVTRLRSLIRDCEDLVESAKQVLLVDPDTGMLNATGLEREISRRKTEGTLRCIIRLRMRATLPATGKDCTPGQFCHLIEALGTAVYELFRHSEAIGIVGRDIVVIFDATVAQATSRRNDIERRLSGAYTLNDGSTIELSVEMEAFEPQNASFLAGLLSEQAPAADPVPEPVSEPVSH